MMTADERFQVEHLLRYAASLEFYDEGAFGSFLRSAAIQLKVPWTIEEWARRACAFTCGYGTSRSAQLAAAERVANGEWP